MTAIGLFKEVAQEATQEELLGLLDLIADRVGILPAVRDPSNALRVSVQGGTLNTLNTLQNIPAVGGYSANQQIPATQNLAAVMSNVNLIEVS